MITRECFAFMERKRFSFWGVLTILILAMTFCTSALAFEARTITSLQLETESSSPGDFCRVGETLFFRANDGIHGYELWKLESPDAQPVMVTDINPGGSSFPEGLVSIGENLFFFADDGANGSQLWTSNGTEEGTSVVKAVFFERRLSDRHLMLAGDRLFFFADEGEGLDNVQLWVSDGTENGTLALKATSLSGYDRELCVVGERVYFADHDVEHGYALWQTDGTVLGTTKVADIYPSGSIDYPPTMFTSAGESLFFLANDGENGRQVYRFDGVDLARVTSIEDRYLAQIFAGPEGNLLIFCETSDLSGEVWNLPAGASSPDLAVTLASNESEYPFLDPMTNIEGKTIFSLVWHRRVSNPYEARSPSELWTLGADGTDATKLATCDGSLVTASETFALLDGQLFFLSEEWITGETSLWRTNGTEGGTVPLMNAEEGRFVRGLYAFGDVLFLKVRESRHGSELWVCDGTSDGTLLHTDINRTSNAGLDVWGDRIYFGAWDESGAGLWSSDGTAGGTGRIAETLPASGYGPCHFCNGDGEIFFYTLEEGFLGGISLWASDGTGVGTAAVADIGPNPDSALVELNGEHYFIRQQAGDSETGYVPQLWKTDGTVEGTTLVADLAVGFAGKNYCLVRSGNRLFFDVENLETREVKLWVSDGTAGGTVTVEAELPQGFIPEMTVNASGEVFFALWGRNGDMTLWKIDGTSDGTVQVALLGTDGGVLAVNPVSVGDRVFFIVYRAETCEIEFWVTEGTEETTHRVADINPDGLDHLWGFVAFDQGVFFIADDGICGRELWKSDGTEEGTVMVADIYPDGHANPMGLEVLDGRLFFSADDGVHGRELWTSDGTGKGTFMVCDAFPGDSNPQNPVLLADELYFTAVDGEGEINLMRVVEGSSGCNGLGLPALGMMLLPLLMLFKK